MTLRSRHLFHYILTLLLFTACQCKPDFAGRSASPHPASCSHTCPRYQVMFNTLKGWFGRKTSLYCSQQFPQVWEDFVDCFVDSVLAGGPVPTTWKKEQVPPSGAVFLPAVPRLVAIGDLHGDLRKARRAFRLGGLTDENDRWIGGTTTAVQVGDQLDRGNNEVQILYWLERLEREAEKAGGKLHILNGNHETMNVSGRFTYATLPGLADFYQWQLMQRWGAALKANCGCNLTDSSSPPRLPPAYDNTSAAAARRAALAPGGAVTRRFLADHPIALQIGSTVFVHGGVLPEHAELGLERINEETREWMLGRSAKVPGFLVGRRAIVWAREYSAEDEMRCDCGALQQALAMLPGAKRMVVGHTIQEAGINSACDDRVFRIDVGLSRGCGDGEPQVLEILNDTEVWQLHEKTPPTLFGTKQKGKAEFGVQQWWERMRSGLRSLPEL